MQGTLTIGNGGNGAGIGFDGVTSGAGTGVINFNESMAYNSSSPIYEFYPVISGAISVVQNGQE